MRVLIHLLCLIPFGACAQETHPAALNPTTRALLMAQRLEHIPEEQWQKMIENPGNWIDYPIVVYEEDTINHCDLQPFPWLIIMPGKRPGAELPEPKTQSR